MPAKKRPRKIYLGRLDYCKNEYQRQKLYKSLCGEVVVYNMYQDLVNVKTFEEVDSMPYEKAQQYIERMRSFFSVSKLRGHWGLSQNEIYKVFKKYNIRMKEKAGGRPPKNPPDVIQETMSVDVVKEKEPERNLQVKLINPQELITQSVKKSKFNITLEGVFKGDNISNKLSNIGLILDPQATYRIQLSISENDNNSLFTINAGGNFTGAEIEKKLTSIKGILSEESSYMIQYIAEEIENEMVSLAIQESAITIR